MTHTTMDPANVPTMQQYWNDATRWVRRWREVLNPMQPGDTITFSPADTQVVTQVRTCIQGFHYRVHDRRRFKTKFHKAGVLVVERVR